MKPSKKKPAQIAPTNLQDALKKATTEMMVLFLLRQKSMYTYEMIQQMRKVSGGMLSFNTLYIAIYRLQENGMVLESEKVVTESNRTRVYFAITPAGQAYLTEMLVEYRAFSEMLDGVIAQDGALFGDEVN